MELEITVQNVNAESMKSYGGLRKRFITSATEEIGRLGKETSSEIEKYYKKKLFIDYTNTKFLDYYNYYTGEFKNYSAQGKQDAEVVEEPKIVSLQSTLKLLAKITDLQKILDVVEFIAPLLKKISSEPISNSEVRDLLVHLVSYFKVIQDDIPNHIFQVLVSGMIQPIETNLAYFIRTDFGNRKDLYENALKVDPEVERERRELKKSIEDYQTGIESCENLSVAIRMEEKS